MRRSLPFCAAFGLAAALAAVSGTGAAAQTTGPTEQTAPGGQAAGGLRLDIAEAEDLARKNADTVHARAALLDAALGAETAARASFYPKVSASASGAYLANPPAGITVAKGSLGNTTIPGVGTLEMPSQDFVVVKDAEDSYFKGNVTLSQPIVAWGKIRAALEIADLDVEAALADRDAAGLDAVREANRAYFSARLAAESLKVLVDVRSHAAAVVADRKTMLDEGLGTRERLLSAQADLAGIDAQIVAAEEGRRTALDSLSALTGLPAGAGIDTISDFRTRLPALDEESIKRLAVASSSARQAADIRLRQASRSVDLASGSAALRPDLAFFASLDASGQTPPMTRSGWTDTWTWDLSLGLSISGDLFDAGASSARIAQARARRDAAAATLQGTETAAALSARRAIQAAREAEAVLRRAEARAQWTAEVLQNAQSSVANQLASRQDLNAAAMQDEAARLDLLNAEYGMEQSLADLDRLARGDLQ